MVPSRDATARRFVAEEHARWTPIVKAAGLKID